jgi:hypothetical protein
LQRALIDQVLAAAVVDVRVATAFNEVAFMKAHPSTLAAPSVVLRSVVANVRTRAGRPGNADKPHPQLRA